MNAIIKKFNWGWGIGIFYVWFVVAMLSLVYMASQESIEFVTTDYYSKELDYQGHIDRVNRTSALAQPLQWQVNSKQIKFKFPVGKGNTDIKADILFYRPSDSKKDFSLTVIADSLGEAVIVSDKLQPGVYRMQIDWEAGSESYYNESIININ